MGEGRDGGGPDIGEDPAGVVAFFVAGGEVDVLDGGSERWTKRDRQVYEEPVRDREVCRSKNGSDGTLGVLGGTLLDEEVTDRNGGKCAGVVE